MFGNNSFGTGFGTNNTNPFGQTNTGGGGFGTNTGGGFNTGGFGTTTNNPNPFGGGTTGGTGFSFGGTTGTTGGTTGGFGGGFGTNTQQQQQQTPFGGGTTGFGFGNTTTQPTNTFGGSNNPFGTTTTNTTNPFQTSTGTTTGTTGAFGFGQTGATGTTGTTGFGFGGNQPTTTNNPFGQTTGTTSLFSNNTTQPTTTTFGATTGGFGFGGNTQTATTPFGGTANAPTNTMFGGGNVNPQAQIFPSFKPVEENHQPTNQKLSYQSLTKMDPYKDRSFEEWRWLYTLASQGKLQENPFQATQQQQQQTTPFGQTGTTGTTGGFGFNQTGTTGTRFNTEGFGTTGGFGFNQLKTGTTTTPSTGFSFGQTGATQAKPQTGFSFGQSTTGGTTLTTGFAFGQPSNTATQPSTGFNFGAGTTGGTGTTGTGFNFGAGTTGNTTGTTGTGFNFGNQPTTTNTGTTGTGFNFGQTGTTGTSFGQQPTTQPNTGFNFGTGTTGQTGTTGTGFNFGGGTTGGTTGTTGFNFGTGGQTTGLNFGTQPTTGATGTGFNFGTGGNTGATGTGFNFGTQPTTATTGFAFGNTGGATGTGFGFGGNTGFSSNVLTSQPTIPLDQLPTAGTDPYGINPLFQGLSGKDEKTVEEEISPSSKLLQRAPSKIRPRTFKKTAKTSLKDRISLVSSETDNIKPTEDLLDTAFTQKSDIKSLVITPENVFDENKRYTTVPTIQRRPSPISNQVDKSEISNLSGIMKPKAMPPTKAMGFEVDTQQQMLKAQFLPKLTKQGYYTKPSMNELKLMNSSQLQKVRDFVVGREGYGEIKFLGDTDVRGLDLDIIVTIEESYVEVYNENDFPEEIKPPVGVQLNKPSIITLYNIYPRQTDSKSLEKFEKKLMATNKKSDSTFIHYSNGEWVFKVEHYTKYGLDEDSDEEIEEIPEPITNQPTSTKYGIMEDESSEDNEPEVEIQEESEQEQMEEDEEIIEDTTRRGFLPRILQLDPKKMYKMKETLLQDEEVAEEQVETRKTKKSRLQDLTKPQVSDSFSFVRKDMKENILYRSRNGLSGFAINPVPSNIKGNKEEEKVNDNPLSSLRRSFRVGFLPNGQIITPQFIRNDSARVSNLLISEIVNKEDSTVDEETEKIHLPQKYESKLHLVFHNCDAILEDSSNVVHFRLKKNCFTELMKQYLDLTKENQEEIKNNSKLTFKYKEKALYREHYEESVWKLMLILFGEIETDFNIYAIDIARKRQLSLWLKEYIPVENIIETEKPSLLRKIYLLLTAGRVAESAQLALENKDIRLSSIISQSSSNFEIQKDLQKQLILWRQNKTVIDPERLRIYQLLAGEVDDSSLTWLQCLGLHMWYKCRPDQTINEVVRSYIDYFETLRSTKPYASLYPSQTLSTVYLDLRYHLIRIYCSNKENNSVFGPIDLHNVLKPYTYSDDLLECQLSWHIYGILRKIVGDSQVLSHIIHTNYALQLELAGYWQWSIFVLQFLESQPTYTVHNGNNVIITQQLKHVYKMNRENSIREVLFKNFQIENEEFVRNTLAINEKWINEAKAIHARYHLNYPELFKSLCLAEKFNDAHDVFLEHLAPLCILKNNLLELTYLLQKLDDEKITKWREGGAIYKTYLNIRSHYEELQQFIKNEGHKLVSENDSVENSETISTAYSGFLNFDMVVTRFLSNEIRHLRNENSMIHRVAISEMSTASTNMLMKVKSFIDYFKTNNSELHENTMMESGGMNVVDAISGIRQDIYLSNRIDLLQNLIVGGLLQ
ncbi:hypothetical protein ABK040_015558 [Willaertia magna]